MGPYKGRLALAGICLIIAAGVGLAFPLVVRYLLDAAFQTRDRQLLDRIALGLLGLFALQGLMNFIQVFILTSTTERVIAGLREDRNSGRSVIRIACTAEIRYFPANSPAHGTRFGTGCRSRTRNISSIPGFAEGAASSHWHSFASIRSPMTPPNFQCALSSESRATLP